MVKATQIKGVSFWAFIWLCLKEAWETSWEKSDTATAIAGGVIGAFIHYFPQWEHAMTSMLWQVPFAALISIVVMRVLLSPFLIYRKRDKEAKVAEKALLELNSGLPVNKPIVVPVGYGEQEKQGYGVFIANDGYAANTISIPDVAIGQTMSRLSFKGTLTRLAPNEKQFLEASIKHPDRVERDGDQLHKEMVIARLDELEVGIVYQGTDFRVYRSKCIIKRNPGQAGLSVLFVGQELIAEPPVT